MKLMRKENEITLEKVFKGVMLTEKEQEALQWLSCWETETVLRITSAFLKIKGRGEKKMENSSLHLCDETYSKLIDMLREHAQQIWREQKKTSCKVIKEGLFPTEAMMTKAGAPAWARPAKWK